MTDNEMLKTIEIEKYNTQYNRMLNTSDDLKKLLDNLITEYQDCKDRRQKLETMLDSIIEDTPNKDTNLVNWSVSMGKTIREIRQVIKSLIYKERILLESITELSKSSILGPKNLSDIVSDLDRQKSNLLKNIILENKQGEFENIQETMGALTYATIMKIQEDVIQKK